MDRPLNASVLRTLYLEWGNPNRYMSYGGCSGKKESLLQITVKTKVTCLCSNRYNFTEPVPIPSSR